MSMIFNDLNEEEEEGSMFSPIRHGSWWLTSKSDPRWNVRGEGYVGGGVMPRGCVKVLAILDEKLGKRPEDLEWGYMKD